MRVFFLTIVFTLVGLGPTLPAALFLDTADFICPLDIALAFEAGTHLGYLRFASFFCLALPLVGVGAACGLGYRYVGRPSGEPYSTGGNAVSPRRNPILRPPGPPKMGPRSAQDRPKMVLRPF